MGKASKPPESPDLPTEDDYSKAREQSPVQWFCGTRKLTGQWGSDAMDLRSEQAPSNATAKK